VRSLGIVCLLAAVCLSAPASAQEGNPLDDCERGVREACWAVRFGNCAHENPMVAIPACTRRLVTEMGFFRTDNVVGGNKRADQAQYYALRGNARFRQGNLDGALSDYNLAIKSYRNVYWIHANRGSAFFEIGNYQAALASFDEALRLAPGNAVLLNARARLLACAPDANVRDGARAVSDSLMAIGLEERVPVIFIDTLAAAHAENGDFQEAVEVQQQAIEVMSPNDREVLNEYRARLNLYQQNMPFRMMSRTQSCNISPRLVSNKTKIELQLRDVHSEV